LVKSIIVMY